MTDWQIHEGDVLERMREMPDNHFDALLCDPPYGLSFMSRDWDHGVPSPEVWAEALRVVKPGGHLLAFGGTRMWHWLAVGIEQGGWEIRDTLMWMYGTGFPKAHDISKGIDKAAGAEREVVGTKYEGNGNGSVDATYGDYSSGHDGVSVTAPATDSARRFGGYKSALKPAYEPIVVAMAPLDGTYAENAVKHGVAGLNVDGGRIGTDDPPGDVYSGRKGKGEGVYGDSEKYQYTPNDAGRYPANLILDEHAARMLDDQSGELSSGGLQPYKEQHDDPTSYGFQREKAYTSPPNSGGASRFFYTAKASRAEREAGLLDVKPDTTDDGRDKPIDNAYQRGKTKRRNTHPTVKPVDLIRYLATLILPPERDTPRRLLTPYSGSGSEMIGAMLAGWDDLTGIELQRKHIDVAEKRLAWWHERGEDAIDADKAERKRREQNEETGQVDLIDALQETT